MNFTDTRETQAIVDNTLIKIIKSLCLKKVMIYFGKNLYTPIQQQTRDRICGPTRGNVNRNLISKRDVHEF